MNKKEVTKRVYHLCSQHLWSLEFDSGDFTDDELDFANQEKDRIMAILESRSEIRHNNRRDDIDPVMIKILRELKRRK